LMPLSDGLPGVTLAKQFTDCVACRVTQVPGKYGSVLRILQITSARRLNAAHGCSRLALAAGG
jgi:hypothetical protein